MMLRSDLLGLALFIAITLSFPLAWRDHATTASAGRWSAVLAAGALTTTVIGTSLIVLGAIF